MNFYFEAKTKKTLDKTIEDLKENLSKHNFGVLWELDFKETLQGKGLDFNKDLKVLEVCNPSRAHEVLSKHIDAAYVLPCKMVVFSKDDYVHIGMVNPVELVNMLEHEDLEEIGFEIEKELKASIKETV